MKPLIDVNTGDLVASGLFPGPTPNQPGIWAEGNNVLFANAGVTKVLGVAPQQTVSGNISSLVQAFVQGERRVYVLSQNAINKWIEGSNAAITPSGLSTSNKWSAISWGTWLIATNNVNAPYVWKNTGIAVPLGGLSGILTRAKLVKKLRNMVIFFGTSSSEQTATWSNVSDPEGWDPTVDGTFAGQLPIRDADSDIVAAWPLSGDMLIYTSDSMIRMSYVGYPDVWGFDPALPGIGAVSDSAVIPVQRMHYGLGRDGPWQTDGVTYVYIGRPEVQTWWEERVDRTKLADVVGVHYKMRNMVAWWFATKAGPIAGLGYDYVKKTWTILDQQATAASDEQAYQWPLVAQGSSWGFFDATDSSDLFGAMDAHISTNLLDAGKPENLKRWDEFRPQLFDVVGQIEVRFGFADRPMDVGDITDWTSWATVGYDNWIGREAVYLVVQLRSTVKSSTWRLGGFTILGETTSYRV